MNYIGKTIEDEEHGRGVIVAETGGNVTVLLDDYPAALLIVGKAALTPNHSPCSWCGHVGNDLTPAAHGGMSVKR